MVPESLMEKWKIHVERVICVKQPDSKMHVPAFGLHFRRFLGSTLIILPGIIFPTYMQSPQYHYDSTDSKVSILHPWATVIADLGTFLGHH